MTTSLKISKELWERGLRYETYFVRIVSLDDFNYSSARRIDLHGYEIGVDMYPAYTLHELLEIMPEMIQINDGKPMPLHGIVEITWLTNKDGDRSYIIGYKGPQRTSIADSWDTNPADAVAKCLIYLIDNNYVQIKDGKVVTA